MSDKFKVEDKVVGIHSGEKGTVSKLCVDEDVVYVRWDKDRSQEMVEVKDLERLER